MLNLIEKSKLLLPAIFLISCGQGTDSQILEAPDPHNEPALFGAHLKALQDIPTSGYLPNHRTPWSGDYWATISGGISHRWQADSFGESYRDFLYDVMSEKEARSLTQESASLLSPSEKYDLIMGDLSFSLTRSEKANVEASIDSDINDVPQWYGLCHGWAAAAILEKQPQQRVTMKAEYGYKIEFYAADIKALLARHYASAQVPIKFLGARCNSEMAEVDSNNRRTHPPCRDTNPGSFHLVIDRYINTLQESFIMDMDGESEVWNQPVIGYDASLDNMRKLQDEPSYEHAADDTEYLVDVDMRVRYVTEASPSHEGIDPHHAEITFLYTLELDKHEKILGGEWISDARPDFLWALERRASEEADGELDYAMINKLLNKSL